MLLDDSCYPEIPRFLIALSIDIYYRELGNLGCALSRAVEDNDNEKVGRIALQIDAIQVILILLKEMNDYNKEQELCALT